MSDKVYTYHEIKEKMAAYCAYQDRCHLETERKLKTFHLIPEARDEILLYLIRENFLNEERFAKSYARGKFYQKKWGKIKIRIELKKRQINDRVIETAMREIDPADYFFTAAKLIKDKAQTVNETNPYRKRQKLTRYMLQKGYEFEIINEIILNEASGE